MVANPKKRRRIKIVDKKRFAISIAFFLVIFLLLVSLIRSLASRGKSQDPGQTEGGISQVENKQGEQGLSLLEEENKGEGKVVKEELLEEEDILALTEDFNYLKNIMKSSHPRAELSLEEANKTIDSLNEEYLNKVRLVKTMGDFKSVLTDYLQALSQDTILADKEEFNSLKEEYESLYPEIFTSEKVIEAYKPSSDEIIDNENSQVAIEKTDEENVVLEKTLPGNLAYIKINSFQESTLDNDLKKVEDFIIDIALYDNLLIDIRGVDSGSSRYWQEFAELFYQGELYLTGRVAHKDKRFLDKITTYTSGNEPYFVISEGWPINEFPREVDFPNEIKRKYETFNRFDYYINPNNSADGGEFSDEDYQGEDFNHNTFLGSIFVLQDESVMNQGDTFAKFCQHSGFANLIGSSTSGGGQTADFPKALIGLQNSGLLISMPSVLGIDYYGQADPAPTFPDIEINLGNNPKEAIIDFFTNG